MKKISAIAILLLVIMIGFSSCKKNDDSTTFNLNASPQQVSSAMSILFSASQTGDGVLTSLTYGVGSTTQTVNNPQLPWSITVNASAGDNITMTASGSASNGSVKISYYGNNGTETVQGEDSYSGSSN